MELFLHAVKVTHGDKYHQRRLEDIRQSWESLKVNQLRAQKRNNRHERAGDREYQKTGQGPLVVRVRARL